MSMRISSSARPAVSSVRAMPSMATPTHGKALFEAAVAELVPQVQAFRDEA